MTYDYNLVCRNSCSSVLPAPYAQPPLQRAIPFNIRPQPISLLHNSADRQTHAIRKIDIFEEALDDFRIIPLQKRIDTVGSYIQDNLKVFDTFNEWVDLNTDLGAEWYKQLAVALAKLPVRAIRNIVRILYSIISEVLNFLVHPSKSVFRLARLLVDLAYELAKPSVWIKIGAGMLGAGLGQTAVSGNPLCLIIALVGGALTIAGLTVEMILKTNNSEKQQQFNDLLEVFKEVSKEIPENILTGFLIGLPLGAL